MHLLDPRGKRNTVDFRQIDIENGKIGGMFRKPVQRRLRIRKPADLVDLRQALTLSHRILDRQRFVVDTDRFHAFRSFPFSAAASGMNSVTSVPFPISLLRIIVPPHIRSMRSFTF